MIPPKCEQCPNSDLCFEHIRDALEEEYLEEIYSLMSFCELLERSEEVADGILTDLHAYI